MSTVTIEEAQAQLLELISQLAPGQEIQIMDRGQPIARLIRSTASPRRPGSAIGQLVILAEDEEHLRDFQEYMP